MAVNPDGAESVVVVVELSVVEVELSEVEEVVNSDFSSLQEMMLKLINDIKKINVNFFIITIFCL